MSTPTEVNRYVHFHGAPAKGKILMVASSPAVSAQTGWPIGFWAAELTHPLRVFQEAGYEVELASTAGGSLMMDAYSNPTDASGYSAHDVISLGYLQQPWFNEMLANTRKLTEAQPDDYVAIFLVGGQGPMYTFRGNAELQKTVCAVLRSRQAIGCGVPLHDPAAGGQAGQRRADRGRQNVDRLR